MSWYSTRPEAGVVSAVMVLETVDAIGRADAVEQLATVDKPGAELEKRGMTKEEIRERVIQRPFKPFRVRLEDGLEIDVPIGDHVHCTPRAERCLCILSMAAQRLSMWGW